MTCLLDASILVPRFIKQASSPTVSEWLSAPAGRHTINTLAVGEFSSAVARLMRMREIGRVFADEVIAALDAWCLTTLNLIDIEPVDIALATVFVRRFDLGLRMPDAIHAATCQRLNLRLATLDQGQYQAAIALGIDAVKPA